MDSDTNTHTISPGVGAISSRRANWTADRDPSTVLVELVAEVTGQSHTALEPLQATIDGDALNALLESADTDDLTVSFSYEALEVMVTSDGLVEVRH